jgi:hypothetical protein
VKIYALGQYLKNINKDIYDRFNKKYNGFIDYLSAYINKLNIIEVSKEEIEEVIGDYWTD